MSFGKHRGKQISKGVSILHSDYDISLDAHPTELVEDFEQEIDYDPYTANIETLATDAQEYVIDNIEHVNAIARELGEDPELIDRERIFEQSEKGKLKMSNVWNGAWNDRNIGTCQERALTLQAMYEELNIDSQYHTGGLRLEDGQTAQHAWTTVENEYISDPSVNGDGLIPINETDRYTENYFWTK